MAPCQSNKKVDAWVKEQSDWLIVAVIPGGLTSILQVGDLVANAQLKATLKRWLDAWRMKKLRTLRDKGHVKLALPREELIDFMEETIAEFNRKQHTNPTIDNCFRKVGQDISAPLEEFFAYLSSLGSKHVYQVLMDAHLENNTHLLADFSMEADQE